MNGPFLKSILQSLSRYEQNILFGIVNGLNYYEISILMGEPMPFIIEVSKKIIEKFEDHWLTEIFNYENSTNLNKRYL